VPSPLDRIEERGADARDLDSIAADRGTAGRRSTISRSSTVHLEVATCCAVRGRLDDELRRDSGRGRAGPASIIASARSAKYAARSRDGGDRIHQLLGYGNDRAEMGERLLGERDVRIVGVRARAEPATPSWTTEGSASPARRHAGG
jgi:hypothetical protein